MTTETQNPFQVAVSATAAQAFGFRHRTATADIDEGFTYYDRGKVTITCDCRKPKVTYTVLYDGRRCHPQPTSMGQVMALLPAEDQQPVPEISGTLLQRVQQFLAWLVEQKSDDDDDPEYASGLDAAFEAVVEKADRSLAVYTVLADLPLEYGHMVERGYTHASGSPLQNALQVSGRPAYAMCKGGIRILIDERPLRAATLVGRYQNCTIPLVTLFDLVELEQAVDAEIAECDRTRG